MHYILAQTQTSHAHLIYAYLGLNDDAFNHMKVRTLPLLTEHYKEKRVIV